MDRKWFEGMQKKDLDIPVSLDEWFLNHGWGEDYWLEIPTNWDSWSDTSLMRYPITKEIINWRKVCLKI